MPKNALTMSSPYIAYVRGLLRLHQLDVDERSESDEAEAVRDSLEAPWSLMSTSERERIKGLSADLYGISDPATTVAPTNESQRAILEAMEARKLGNWDESLGLIRTFENHFEPGLIAYVRGSVWMEAGDDLTASVFFKHAFDLHKDNDNYRIMYLTTLASAEPVQALRLANEILQAANANSPQVVTKAADIYFMSTKSLSESDRLPKLDWLAGILENVLTRLEHAQLAKPSVFAHAVTLAAFCQDGLGKSSAALSFYNLGVAANPSNDALLVARGILQYGKSDSAIRDFQLAIQLKSPLVWPWYFLGHYYLTNEQYEECLKACEQALKWDSSNSLNAALYEWIGISRSELGMPAEKVREALEEAVRLDPENERIRKNLAAFASAVEGTMTTQHWEKLPVSTFQMMGREMHRSSIGVAA
jgi:tetratricopeptide (TPR) repeat protein